MNYQDFDFVVEDMTDEQAEALMDIIIIFVASLGLVQGGGFHPKTDADYEGVKNVEDS